MSATPNAFSGGGGEGITTGTSTLIQKGDGTGGLIPAEPGTDYLVPPSGSGLLFNAAAGGLQTYGGAGLVMIDAFASPTTADAQSVLNALSVTPVADGTYSFITSITTVNGVITAIATAG